MLGLVTLKGAHVCIIHIYLLFWRDLVAVDAVTISRLLCAHMCQVQLMTCLSGLGTAWNMNPGCIHESWHTTDA